MKNILLIGMGKFGTILGEKLLEQGNEVMVVDKNMDKIELCSNKFTHAVTANCMNPETLKTFDVASFDACIVAIGDDFQSSLEITSLLKELGAKYQKISNAYRFEVENTQKATELILKHPNIFKDYEIIKGKMDSVFLNVTGKNLKEASKWKLFHVC